jgi:hypothetical protein
LSSSWVPGFLIDHLEPALVLARAELSAIADPAFTLAGFRNKDLRCAMPAKNATEGKLQNSNPE